MPTSYSGRDGEDDPDQEQARLKQRPAVQPTNTPTPLYGGGGAQAQPTMARTFQQPQMPGGVPGQQSQTPWSMNLGSLNGAQGAQATPWAQSVMPQAQAQPAAPPPNAGNGGMLQTLPGQWDDDNARAQQRAHRLAAPNWGALAARFGGAPMGGAQGGGGLAALFGGGMQHQQGGGMQGGMPGAAQGGGGGNPWLQNLQSSLAQRFAAMQQRGGGMPGRGL
jgi:hypothetical protein